MGIDFSDIKSRYHADLFIDLLPFFDAHVIDHEQGGFCCAVRADGERVSDAKKTWFQGRGAWVYSHLYATLAPEQYYLDVAERAITLVERTRPADGGSWPITLNRDGSAATPPDPEIYGDLFVAEGMAAFAEASGDERYWDEAKSIILRCVEKFDDPGYGPGVPRMYFGAEATERPGVRPSGVWMVLIRGTTQMLRRREDAELRALLRRSISAVLDAHLNPRFGLINEMLDHDMSRLAEYEGFVYLGHAIETLWMILDAAIFLGDESLFDRAAGVFRRHCEVAKDRVYGGYYRELSDVDDNSFSLDKTLWVQEEVAIGALIIARHRVDPWAEDVFGELDRYLHEKFPQREIGSPLWRERSDRQVTELQKSVRAENYHHPRFLMRVLAEALAATS